MSDDPEYDVNFREHPERYRVERGEQGVFKVEPYKSALLPLWGYADRETADAGGEAIYRKFLAYKENGEFPGMDMARKYLQMGYTRAMRYARYPGGQKYVDGEERDPTFWADHDKREAALVYEVWWELVESDEAYTEQREAWREERG
ncbi:DUF4385 domain-containing protein [Natronomonas sp. EA1]|uniref:DUF4385 domain-containing protein n=1 Tax=Natronomonas sp. EA1 TaxID=3421655 RepID=UPI003EB6B00B